LAVYLKEVMLVSENAVHRPQYTHTIKLQLRE